MYSGRSMRRRFRFVADHRDIVETKELCKLVGVARSVF